MEILLSCKASFVDAMCIVNDAAILLLASTSLNVNAVAAEFPA